MIVSPFHVYIYTLSVVLVSLIRPAFSFIFGRARPNIKEKSWSGYIARLSYFSSGVRHKARLISTYVRGDTVRYFEPRFELQI